MYGKKLSRECVIEFVCTNIARTENRKTEIINNQYLRNLYCFKLVNNLLSNNQEGLNDTRGFLGRHWNFRLRTDNEGKKITNLWVTAHYVLNEKVYRVFSLCSSLQTVSM